MKDTAYFYLILASLFLSLALSKEVGAQPPMLRVAVIDTGLDLNDERFQDVLCESKYHKDFTGAGIEDRVGHSTWIVGKIKEIAGNQGGYCIMVLKFYLESNPGITNLSNEVAAINFAVSNGASIINVSAGGYEFSETEYEAIARAPQVEFFVAAGNNNQSLDNTKYKYYPASYELKNVTAVGATDKDMHRISTSNYGTKVMTWEVGDNLESTLPNGARGRLTGTSMACAVKTAKVIRARVK